MTLTGKDKEFLEQLRALLDAKQLRIELDSEGCLRFVLRQNYGDKIARNFHITRQGVRWRFNHLFNQEYVNALTAILLIESAFGSELRHQAMAIAKQRVERIREARRLGSGGVPRRERAEE